MAAMFILRPVKHDDLQDLLTLADVMAPGITTFPPNEQVITNKIDKSIVAFGSPLADTRSSRDFLLVLEDKEKNRVIGTTGIYSHIGQESPFYSFKRHSEVQQTLFPGDDKPTAVTSTTLHLTNALEGGTEVGTLLLHPDYNGFGLGKLLAKARYLFIRMYNQLFTEPLFAELRGWSTDDDISPFWEAVGRHFFAGMDYSTADYLSATTDKQFIADLFPRYPIYEHLLPDAAIECINKANRKGKAALQMLYKEGFKDDGFVDIFDAGATVVAQFDNLHTYKNAHQCTVIDSSLTDSAADADHKALIASGDFDTVCFSLTSQYQLSENNLSLTSDHKQQAGIQSGDQVWICEY